MDPKVIKLMNLVGVDNLNDFRRKTAVDAVKELQDCYAKSTMEDLTWRLVRELKNISNFPKQKITAYNKLWRKSGGLPKYKKVPTGDPTGRPAGTKNKC